MHSLPGSTAAGARPPGETAGKRARRWGRAELASSSDLASSARRRREAASTASQWRHTREQRLAAGARETEDEGEEVVEEVGGVVLPGGLGDGVEDLRRCGDRGGRRQG